MNTQNSNIFYHLIAFLTVAIWGTTFVSTKVLMLNGLSPAQIFTLRFSIAYILMLAFNHRRFFADSWQDELKMALLGITGGSLYFCSENEAMNFTTTTNTSLIVCSCPLFATLLVRLVYKDSNRIHIVQLHDMDAVGILIDQPHQQGGKERTRTDNERSIGGSGEVHRLVLATEIERTARNAQ